MLPDVFERRVDARGEAVPYVLSSPFLTRAKLLAIVAEIQTLRVKVAKIVQINTGGDRIDMPHFHEYMKNAEDLLLKHAPALLCTCLKPTGCPNCEGRGWLDATDIDRISSQLPSQLSLAHYGVKVPSLTANQRRGRAVRKRWSKGKLTKSTRPKKKPKVLRRVERAIGCKSQALLRRMVNEMMASMTVEEKKKANALALEQSSQ